MLPDNQHTHTKEVLVGSCESGLAFRKLVLVAVKYKQKNKTKILD
jgi:hypothetical protein